MAVTTGTRLNDGSKGITRWSADTDSLTRQQMDDSHYVLENLAVKYDQGAGTGSRPAAAAAEGAVSGTTPPTTPCRTAMVPSGSTWCSSARRLTVAI